MKLNIYANESYETWLKKQSLEIETDDYPELNGLSEDEIRDYIEENAWQMKPTNSNDYDSLVEELLDMDIEHDTISNEDFTIGFE